MAFMTMDDVQRWLESYGEFATAIENQRERLETLRSRLEDPRAATPSGLPSGRGDLRDRLGAELGHLEDLERRLQQDRQEAQALYRKIENAICQITGPGWAHRRAVLRMRYLDLESWEQVCTMLFRRNADFAIRYDSYQRRTFKIHRQALNDLLEILSQEAK